MTAILGISAFYHDAAAALLVDGEVVAAAQEERFTRKKHDASFPANAVDYCLREAGIGVGELELVAFYEKPLLKFDRLLETYLAYAPLGFRSFTRAMPQWLQTKLRLSRTMRKHLPGYDRRFLFPEHHESHAASAFFPSPFDEAAILTLDGVGEWATASYGVGRGNRIELTHQQEFPHSLGLLYSAFTYHCGFRVNSGEYKLMGLAPYGTPRFADLIFDELIDVRPDGSFQLALEYFTFCHGLHMTGRKMTQLLGTPPRSPESPIRDVDLDLAASIQLVTEEVMLRTARHVHAETGMRNLCMAGGVALNCVGNGRVLREGPFDQVWIQPAAGDAGGALGAAYVAWHQVLDAPRTAAQGPDRQHASRLGPSFDNVEIKSFLDSVGAVYHAYDREDDLVDFVAGRIAEEDVVGHFDGRMEFGPRALGNRSIIGDARSPRMQSVMNQKIKFRESFRPFAPAVLREHVNDWFETRIEEDSPYMLLVAPVASSRRRRDAATDKAGLERRSEIRSEIPAVTHVDDSARLQTVDAERGGRFYDLLQRFHERTGCPVLINTSFNIRSEPIVCSPEDAWRCFMGTDMDLLVVGNCVLRKSEQPASLRTANTDYRDRFTLD